MKNTMKKLTMQAYVVVLSALVLFLAAPAASAAVADCDALIVTLQNDTAAVTITGSKASVDRAKLQAVLTAAITDLDSGDYLGALSQLAEYVGDVYHIYLARHISKAHATTLIAEAAQAGACTYQLLY